MCSQGIPIPSPCSVLQKALLSHHNLCLCQERKKEALYASKPLFVTQGAPRFFSQRLILQSILKTRCWLILWMVILEPISYLELYEKYVVYRNRFLAMPHIRPIWFHIALCYNPEDVVLVLLGLFSLLIQHAVHWTTVSSPTKDSPSDSTKWKAINIVNQQWQTITYTKILKKKKKKKSQHTSFYFQLYLIFIMDEVSTEVLGMRK